MMAERLSLDKIEMPEDRIGRVRDWGEMHSYISPDVPERDCKILKGYFRAQVRLVEGKKVRARQLLSFLEKRNADFRKLEDENDALFASIDIAVRGATNRGSVSTPSRRY